MSYMLIEYILDHVYAKYLREIPKIKTLFTKNNTDFKNLQNTSKILFWV